MKKIKILILLFAGFFTSSTVLIAQNIKETQKQKVAEKIQSLKTLESLNIETQDLTPNSNTESLSTERVGSVVPRPFANAEKQAAAETKETKVTSSVSVKKSVSPKSIDNPSIDASKLQQKKLELKSLNNRSSETVQKIKTKIRTKNLDN